MAFKPHDGRYINFMLMVTRSIDLYLDLDLVFCSVVGFFLGGFFFGGGGGGIQVFVTAKDSSSSELLVLSHCQTITFRRH